MYLTNCHYLLYNIYIYNINNNCQTTSGVYPCEQSFHQRVHFSRGGRSCCQGGKQIATACNTIIIPNLNHLRSLFTATWTEKGGGNDHFPNNCQSDRYRYSCQQTPESFLQNQYPGLKLGQSFLVPFQRGGNANQIIMIILLCQNTTAVGHTLYHNLAGI